MARETFTGYTTNGLNTLGAPLAGANPSNDGVNHTSGIAPPGLGETVRFWFSVWMRNAGYGGIPGETIIGDASGNTLFGIRKTTATTSNVYLFGKNSGGSEALSTGC